MITVNNNPSRQDLVVLIESNNRIIDLDPASIKCDYCEQVNYYTPEAFLSKRKDGKTVTIKNVPASKGNALRITITGYTTDSLVGFSSVVTWKENSLAILDIDSKILYIVNVDDETWFVHEFRKHRGVALYETAVRPLYVKCCEYVMVANGDIKSKLERYL